MASPTLQLLVAVSIIALNASFVLAEFALVRLRASKVELLVRAGHRVGPLLQEMLRNLDFYLSAAQFGITMASLGLGWVGEPTVARLLQHYLESWDLPISPAVIHGLSFTIAFGIITFLHIVFGELVPRSIALQKAEAIAIYMAVPFKIFAEFFRLPIAFMSTISVRLLGLFRMRPAAEADSTFSEDEMRVILGSSEDTGSSLERLMLLENVFDFGTAKVSEAMVPQYRVAFLSLAKTWEENLAIIRSRRFSRYPLCETDLDTVIGLIHVKDILFSTLPAGTTTPPDLRTLRRDIVEVPPGEALQKLLKTFPDRGIQMAVVRNPTGGIAGIVTLEDILEELVGEIHDEYDLPQAWSLMDVLVPSAVKVGVDIQDRKELIRYLIARLKEAHTTLDGDEAVKVVWEREEKFSSAVGHGVAVPHGRMANLDRPLVALARSPKGYPFPAPDKIPVRLVFLILTPTSSPVAQLRILARIASLVSNENLRRRLLRAKTEEHLLDILRTADTVLASP